MPVKFFCNSCEVEIWLGLTAKDKETTTISEAERTCLCSACLLKEFNLQPDW